MSISKFQQLVEIVNEDYTKTYQYLEKNFTFINQLTQKLADDFGCSLKDLFFVSSEEKIFFVENGPEDLITIENDCSFKFRLLIKIPVQPFNMNVSGHSFSEKNLVPPSGVVLVMAIKQYNNSFIVEVSNNIRKADFTINPTVDDSWVELLECCFELTKAMLEGGLERRISELGILRDNTSKQNFGFTWREK